MSGQYSDGNIPEESLGKLFRSAAMEHADQMAVNFGQDWLSYRELLNNAERIAGGLRAAGVKPGDFVGIYADRSINAVKAIVGTVLSGAIYVPLSPQWPRARLLQVCEQAKISTILDCTSQGLKHEGSVVLSVSSLLVSADRYTADDGRSAEDCLYLLFTSGSSGKPKGVLVPHRGMNRLVFDRDIYPVEPGMGFSHSAPLSFDMSAIEIWLPLLTGGTLFGFEKEDILSARAFRLARKNRKLHFCILSCTLFEMLLSQDNTVFSGIDRLYLGGEALHPAAVAKMMAGDSADTVINAYGPTEVSVISTFHEIRPEDVKAETIPIGKTIARTAAYVLDENQQLVEPGVEGELCLAGDGVALGYLNEPVRTAEVFIESNVSGKCERLYRTGDRVRRREDGLLEYLGRIDEQIKLRGHRIEPGEIEATIQTLPSVQRAVTRICEPAPGDRRLAVWIKPEDGHKISDDEALLAQAKSHAAQRLPDYMVPSWFMLVDSFPLTVHGKLDVSALPKPAPSFTVPNGIDLTDPMNGVLATLRQLLVDENFDANDSFLEKGGDSLLAVRGVQQIFRACGVAPPVALFFEPASASAISNFLGLAAWAHEDSSDSGNATIAVTRF